MKKTAMPASKLDTTMPKSYRMSRHVELAVKLLNMWYSDIANPRAVTGQRAVWPR